MHKLHRDRQGPGRRSRPIGGRSGLRNDIGRTEPRRVNPQGLTGALSTSRSAKGERSDRRRGAQNRLAEQVCLVQQGLGEQVEDINTVSAGTGSVGRLE